LEDLALQSDKVLLLDHHTDVFIWSGRETTGEQHNWKRDVCSQYIHSLVKHRFPQPNIMQFKVSGRVMNGVRC
jgi:hypothetical protein